jgi:hypothetical protein
LRSRTRFRRYRGRRFPFSCVPLPDSFSAVPSASGPVLMSCAPRLIFDDIEGVGSRFHVLRSRTHFRWYQGRRFPFSCFTRPNSIATISRVSGLAFMFCARGLVFGGTEGVRSRFHVLRSRTRCRRCRICRVPFSCFALQDSFSTVKSASGPVFMFCAPGLVFSGVECVVSRFHVLRYQNSFRVYRGRPILFSHFARRDSFSTIPRASVLVFIFCASGLIFDGIGGVGYRFHVLRSQTRCRRCRVRRVPFSYFVL